MFSMHLWGGVSTWVSMPSGDREKEGRQVWLTEELTNRLIEINITEHRDEWTIHKIKKKKNFPKVGMLADAWLSEEFQVQGQEFMESLCGGLNENGSCRLIRSVTIGWCGLIGGSVTLGMGFEVSEAQAKPSITLSSYCLPVQV